MAGRVRPVRVLQDPDLSPLWRCGREPLDYGSRSLGGGGQQSLLHRLMGDMQSRLDEMERLRVVLLDAYPLLALDEEGPQARKAARQGSRRGPARPQLTLDVSGFSPEELSVKLEGRKLTVTGERDRRSESGGGGGGGGGYSSHEYRRLRGEVTLPEDADLEAVACALAQDGRLCVEAPRLAPPPPEERPGPAARTPDAGGQEEAEAAGEE